jgi:AraC-like DNA-binding protein
MEKPGICIYHSTQSFREKIKPSIQNYRLITKKSLKPLDSPFIQKDVACIVIEIYGNIKDIEMALAENKHLAKLPIIAVMNDNNWETIRKLGKIGIDRVIAVNEVQNLELFLFELLNHAAGEVKLKDIFIDIQHCASDTIQHTLKLIEENYRNISTVEELADMLNLNSCYLTQMFSDQKLYNPKKLLKYMKIRHALNIMEQSQLTLEAVSDLSGFDNYQQFSRCVTGIFDKSSSDIQRKVKEKSAETFWKEHGPYPPPAITVISS